MAHTHLEWKSASMVAAMSCSVCGAMVAGEYREKHQEFHDLIATIAGIEHQHETGEVLRGELADHVAAGFDVEPDGQFALHIGD